MILKKSPKTFETYKCDKPENTIKRISDGFKRIDLNLLYKENKIGKGKSELYTGESKIKELNFSTYGKGTTSLLSKASAFAEMVERFSATMFFFQNIPIPKDSYRYRKLLDDLFDRKFLKNFKKTEDDVINFEDLNSIYFGGNLSREKHKMYQKSNLLNKSLDSFSLTDKKFKSIPLRVIETISGSNGLAAGNTIEEAIAQATCEIFERYAVVKVLLKRMKCSTIDQKTISNEKILDYIEMFKSLNIETVIKDFTMGNNIPTIGLVFINNNIKDKDNPLKKRQYYKRIECASHVNLEEAILRCFTEYMQTLDTGDEKELMMRKETDLIYKCWTEIIGNKYSGNMDPFRYLIRNYEYYSDLDFLDNGEIISYNNLKSIYNNDSLDDCNELISVCKRNNWDMLTVDYTHNIIGFPVVRVIIPPISNDFDPFIKGFTKESKISERVDYFYGIKDFYLYATNDKWIKNEKKIKILINNIEDFLSKEPSSYIFTLIRENFFRQTINLYEILAILYNSINKNEKAKKYLKVIKLLKERKCISKETMILDNCNEKNLFNFDISKNPFNPEEPNFETDKYYTDLIKKISDSFFNS